MKRRAANPFTLSFLDCMFCGFGAVVLLVMIANFDLIMRREHVERDLRGSVERLQAQLRDETRRVARLASALEMDQLARTAAERSALQLDRELASLDGDLTSAKGALAARSAEVAGLSGELRALQRERTTLAEAAAGAGAGDEEGERIRSFPGQGDRQYLTGLKVGGERVLILIDASASMLAETIVNAVLRRNLPPQQRVRAAKWQRTLATVNWITSQIPATSSFQIFAFNESVWPVLRSGGAQWLDAGDLRLVERTMGSLRKLVPEKGTSLQKAFSVLKQLSPAPDNIFLLTDGLPTQGADKPWRSKVSAKQRMRHFDKAVQGLTKRIPVNVILFPMEGDPEAASAFWKLAARTRGAFLSPARDWP